MISLIALLSIVVQRGASSNTTRPNVLFLVIDDLRAELPMYGATHVTAPNLKKLVCTHLPFRRPMRCWKDAPSTTVLHESEPRSVCVRLCPFNTLLLFSSLLLPPSTSPPPFHSFRQQTVWSLTVPTATSLCALLLAIASCLDGVLQQQKSGTSFHHSGL